MDIAMERMNGIEATREIRSRLPLTQVVALSVHSDKRYVEHMFEAGAIGYVLKEAASDELIEAIRAVSQGQRFISPSVEASDTGNGQGRVTRNAYSRLAPREREVLKLLSEGETSRQIAEFLSISPRTVETHRRNIMRKLGIHSVAALTKYAIREGLTSVER